MAGLGAAGGLLGAYAGNKAASAERSAYGAAADDIRAGKSEALGYQKPYADFGKNALSPLSALLFGKSIDPKTGKTIFTGAPKVEKKDTQIATIGNRQVLIDLQTGERTDLGPAPISATAEQKAIEQGEKAQAACIKEVQVVVKGVGSGRESAIRSFAAFGVEIVSIIDKTPVPHKGPKHRKPRHV